MVVYGGEEQSETLIVCGLEEPASYSVEHKLKTGNKNAEPEGRISNRGFGRNNDGEETDSRRCALDSRALCLKREPEMRKARQWWLTTFWPKDADEYMKVATTMGTDQNNWLRQVISYGGNSCVVCGERRA